MILLLLCIPTLVLSAEIAEIDWKTCDKKTKCFMHDTCKGKTSNGLEEYPTPVEIAALTKIDTCKTGFQNYIFSDNVILYQIQAEGEMAVANAELAVYLGDKLVVGCRIDAKGEVKAFSDKKFKNYIALFEGRSAFKADRAFCSIKLENMIEFDKTIKGVNADGLRTLLTSIRYLSQDGTIVSHEMQTSPAFYKGGFVENCNPFFFESEGEKDKFHALPLVEKDREILDCTNYKHMKYKLWSLRKDGEGKEMESLTCTPSHIYEMKIPGEPDAVKLDHPELYSFFCVAPIDRTCKEPVCSSSKLGPKEICPLFTPGTDATAAIFKCTGNKWLIDDQYYVLEDAENPICKLDDITNQPAFYIVLKSGEEILLSGSTKASCFTEYDCAIYSPLDYSDCKSEDCGVLDRTNELIKCQDHDKFNLRATQPNSNMTLNDTKYECQGASGKWKGDNGTILLEGARVYCDSIVEISEESELSGEGWVIIAICFAASVFLLVVIVVVVCIYLRGRRARKVKVKNTKWMKMDAAARTNYAKTSFQDVMSASVNLVNGLEVIEMLLETNTEDLEVWEEVYPFLLRLKSVMNTKDYNLAHLLSRYMYLRAKRIIDEHGWISQTPITKSNPAGLMRTVAIRLLAYCAYGKHDPNAMKLIEAGFRRLGFNAVEQYPHCGLMWALAPALSDSYHHPEDAARNDVHFNFKAFTDRMVKYKNKPPVELAEADIIPQFGSISDQAMFAHGAMDNAEFHVNQLGRIFVAPKKGTLAEATKLLEGMAGSMGDDPGPRIFMGTHKYHPENKPVDGGDKKKKEKPFVAIHEMARQIAPADVWNALTKSIMKTLIYGQHSQDAKRLACQMMPEEPQPSEYYMALRESQEQFAVAIEGQTKELWLWLMRRTDVEELKQRPVLLKLAPAKNLRQPTKVAEIDAGINGRLEKFIVTNFEPEADTPAANAAAPPSSDPAPTPAAPAAAASAPAPAAPPSSDPAPAPAAPVVPAAAAPASA